MEDSTNQNTRTYGDAISPVNTQPVAIYNWDLYNTCLEQAQQNFYAAIDAKKDSNGNISQGDFHYLLGKYKLAENACRGLSSAARESNSQKASSSSDNNNGWKWATGILFVIAVLTSIYAYSVSTSK